MQIQYKLQYLLERLFYYASGTTYACMCMHILCVLRHSKLIKPQSTLANKESLHRSSYLQSMLKGKFLLKSSLYLMLVRSGLRCNPAVVANSSKKFQWLLSQQAKCLDNISTSSSLKVYMHFILIFSCLDEWGTVSRDGAAQLHNKWIDFGTMQTGLARDEGVNQIEEQIYF